MGWASERFWKDPACLGIYPNVPDEETRCVKCKKRDLCPAYDTGVIYPCPYYKED